MEIPVKELSVHFFQHFRGGTGKARQDHVEVIEKNHSILDAGRSGRQFEGAHPIQPHRVKIHAGTRSYVEAAKLELMTNFDLISWPIGPIPGRTEYRPQTAQRK